MSKLNLPPTVEVRFLRFNHAHRRLVDSLLAGTDLHRGQPPLLFALSLQDGLSNAELAECMFVTPPTISNMVKRLRKSGFVEKRRDSEDERVTRVYLTEKGRRATGRLREISAQVNEAMIVGLSAEETKTLFAILTKITTNMENALAQVDS